MRRLLVAGLIAASMPFIASAAIFEELQVQLQALMARVEALKAQRENTAAPAPTGAASSCPNLTKNLSRGSRGSDVTQLQQFLIAQNLLAFDSATGFFGAMTERAVQQWQSDNSITSYGNPVTTGYGAVGPKTRAKMAMACVAIKPSTTSVQSPVTPSTSQSPSSTSNSQLLPAVRVAATLSTNSASITSGQIATLTWTSTNAISCSGSNFSTNNLTSGSVNISPTISTTYTITCADTSTSASAGVAVSVVAPTPTVSAVVQTSNIIAGTVNFQIGFSLTEQISHTAALSSAYPANLSAMQSMESLLMALNAPQNVYLMGWGPGNPEPSPGEYDWEGLDARVGVMGETVPVSHRMMTLCLAPGWMKGTDDWGSPEVAVLPEYFDDFAMLAAEAAKRYDGTHMSANGTALPKVDYFNVWCEMKGFWNNPLNRRDYEGYTSMYNQVYEAVKAVRADAKIGGPYTVITNTSPSYLSTPSSISGPYGVVDQRALDAIAYWLQHKIGADFITVDGGPQVFDLNYTMLTDGFSAIPYFTSTAAWLRNLDPSIYPGARTLPLYWMEFYPGIATATGAQAVAIDIASAINAGVSGFNKILFWTGEGDANGTNTTTGVSTWTDTTTSGGGQPTTLFATLKEIHNNFPVGTPLYTTTVSGPVMALVGPSKALLVNETAKILGVSLDGKVVSLSPYQVTVVDRPTLQ